MPPRLPNLPPGLCICRDLSCAISFGFCHCGCGQKTTISVVSRSGKRGLQIGMPQRFVLGHGFRKRPVIEKAMPFRIDGVYCRLVPLTRGFHAIVWESDYVDVMRWAWFTWPSKSGTVYAAREVYDPKKKQQSLLYMHTYLSPPPDGMEVDHKSGVGLDNRRDNFRHLTHEDNLKNLRRYSSNTTGIKGVCKEGNVYRASINVNGKQINLGRRKTLEEAGHLRQVAEVKYYGELRRF